MTKKIKPFDAGSWFPIHNAVFDVIMPRLSPDGWKVLCVAIRQTWDLSPWLAYAQVSDAPPWIRWPSCSQVYEHATKLTCRQNHDYATASRATLEISTSYAPTLDHSWSRAP